MAVHRVLEDRVRRTERETEGERERERKEIERREACNNTIARTHSAIQPS